MTDKLNEIATFCGKNNIELTLLKSESNSIDYLIDEKKLIINFSEFTNDKFLKLLEEKLQELKELFQ